MNPCISNVLPDPMSLQGSRPASCSSDGLAVWAWAMLPSACCCTSLTAASAALKRWPLSRCACQ